MAILYDQQSPDIAQIKMSIGVYLRNYIRGYIPQLAGESNHGLSPESLQALMETFFSAIMSPLIEMPIKRHLFLVFESLITLYQTQQIDKPKLDAFFTTLLESVSLRITQAERNMEVTKGGLLIFQAVLFSLRDSRFLTKIFPVISPFLCKVVDDHIAQIGGILMELPNLLSQGTPFSEEHPLI